MPKGGRCRTVGGSLNLGVGVINKKMLISKNHAAKFSLTKGAGRFQESRVPRDIAPTIIAKNTFRTSPPVSSSAMIKVEPYQKARAVRVNTYG